MYDYEYDEPDDECPCCGRPLIDQIVMPYDIDEDCAAEVWVVC